MSCHAGEIQTVRDGSKGPSVLGMFCLSRTSTPLSGSFSTNEQHSFHNQIISVACSTSSSHGLSCNHPQCHSVRSCWILMCVERLCANRGPAGVVIKVSLCPMGCRTEQLKEHHHLTQLLGLLPTQCHLSHPGKPQTPALVRCPVSQLWMLSGSGSQEFFPYKNSRQCNPNGYI